MFFLPCYGRPLDTIVMDPKLKNYIVEDAQEFFASESWYAERGLPFRRGVRLLFLTLIEIIWSASLPHL